jgi:hypothetical protein
MHNAEMSVDGDILTIKVDLSKRYGPSSSGKTIIVATTAGNMSVPGHKSIKLGLNAYEKNPDYVEGS